MDSLIDNLRPPRSERGLGGVGYQIPRNALALLMLGQVAAVLPHAAHLSLWIIAVGLVCGWWRWMVYQGRLGYPRAWVKVLLVFASGIGLALDNVQAFTPDQIFAGAFSLETMVGLLIAAFALKLLEMKTRRDAYLVIFSSYFVIAMEFLFDQSIPIACYGVFAMAVVTAGMIGLNQMHTAVRPVASLKLAGLLMAQALPLMLILFLFFPRVAPLWSVPLPGAATTGISDRVTPGDVARLTRSDEIAFRVMFDGEVPRQSELYWRGLVYHSFEGGTWGPVPEGDWPEELVQSGSWKPAPRGSLRDAKYLAYEVLLEPTHARWLFALGVPWPLTSGIRITPDFRLKSSEPVHALLRYEVHSYPELRVDRELPEWIRDLDTHLPPNANPRIRAFARALYAESSGTSDYVVRVLDYIRTEPYHYTLQPPRLSGANTVDAFWFDTRRGFCSHFAGAFVYLMRAVGVPARMVGGYQGGKVNPVTGHLVVRQYDAHAWTEVWERGRGWIRVDPTAAVAPERIEQGLDAALSSEERAALSMFTNLRLGAFPALADVMYYVESLEHRWNIWVVGYDGNLQKNYLKELIGEISPLRIGLAMLIGGGLSLSLVVFGLFWRRRGAPAHPVVRMFRRFCEQLARQGVGRRPEETPGGFLGRVARERGLAEGQFTGLVEQIDGLLYNPAREVSPQELRRLRRALRRARLRLALNTTG